MSCNFHLMNKVCGSLRVVILIPLMLMVVYCICCCSRAARAHEFCGNSIIKEEATSDNYGSRSKRFAPVVDQAAQQGGRRTGNNYNENDGNQTPANNQQQEDQIVIDESNQANGYVNGDSQKDANYETGARIGCPEGGRMYRGGGGGVGLSRQAAVGGGGSLAGMDDCYAKTIETAVFIDQALDNKFIGLSGGLVELNKLVLTIMNQVQLLFRYSSMKVPIRIKLVLVEHLKDNEKRGGGAMPNAERGDIDAYLSNFCNWQSQRLEREKRISWDHAILLSGLDLYKVTPTKNHTGVLGLAWVGGMCKGNYSCTINEASNLESAFVIAHEIGHSLGIMHDGQRNTCDPNGYIMSERTGAGKVHWSRCSINYLNDSINKRQLACLDSEQNSAVDPMYDLAKLRLPGQVYTINDQCRLAFGNNYTSFVTRQQPFNSVCRELWCVAGTWAKAAHPALEGSSCGDQGTQVVCREGKCG